MPGMIIITQPQPGDNIAEHCRIMQEAKITMTVEETEYCRVAIERSHEGAMAAIGILVAVLLLTGFLLWKIG